MRRPSLSDRISTFVRSRLSKSPAKEPGVDDQNTLSNVTQHDLEESDTEFVEQPLENEGNDNDQEAGSDLEDQTRPYTPIYDGSQIVEVQEDKGVDEDEEDQEEYLEEVKLNDNEEIEPKLDIEQEAVGVAQQEQEKIADVQPEAGMVAGEPKIQAAKTFEERPMRRPEPSHETNYLYIQMTRSFRQTTKQAFAQSQAEEMLAGTNQHSLQYYEAVGTAIFTQNAFHNFSLIIQGFLSGLAVGHAFFAFVFADPDILVRGYQWMAIPAQALFYFCYAISAIDAFDRFEASKTLRTTLQDFLTLQKGSLAILIWMGGCACSIMMTQPDEYLASWDLDLLIKENRSSTLQSDGLVTADESSNVLIGWRWLSLARAVLALLGWLLLALQPSANFTRDHLANFMPKPTVISAIDAEESYLSPKRRPDFKENNGKNGKESSDNYV